MNEKKVPLDELSNPDYNLPYKENSLDRTLGLHPEGGFSFSQSKNWYIKSSFDLNLGLSVLTL